MSGAVGARPTSPEQPPSLAQAAFAGRCPRCGQRTLFAGLIRFAPKCRACGLDFAAFNVGDGPAALLILIVGALVTALAIVLKLTLAPPIWVHVLIWPPVIVAAVLGSLRLSKAALLALEYRHSAREGEIRKREP
jgi:uncharacterized protein (DUF983 family)